MTIEIGKLTARLFLSSLKDNPGDQGERKARSRYTIGSGILVGDDLVLTCGHVVNAALNRDEMDQTPPDVGEILLLDFPTTEINAGLHYARVITDKWFPPSDSADTRHLEDAVLLQLDSPVEFDIKDLSCVNWSDADYPDKAFKAIGFSQEGGIWIDGECQGRNADGWIQLDSDKYDISTGCSGGPVFDQESFQLIGMMVAEYSGTTSSTTSSSEKHKTAYLISTRRLGEILPSQLYAVTEATPRTVQNAAPELAKQLSCILDRVQHLKKVEGFLNTNRDKRHPCFLFEFIEEDMPEFFARQLQLRPYLKNYHPQRGIGERLDITDLSQGNPDESFKQKLQDKVGDIRKWLETGQFRKVVYTTIELNKGVSTYTNTINQFLAEIEANTPNLQVVVLVGCCRKPAGFWGRRQQATELKKIGQSGSILLEPLPEVNSGELVNWMKELPTNITEQFDNHQLLKEFRRILPTGTQVRYLNIQNEVEDLLTQYVVTNAELRNGN